MQKEMTRRQIYLEILELGILSFRMAAMQGDSAKCVIEADHIHNIPRLLLNDDPVGDAYYLKTERPSFQRDAPDGISRFHALWQALDNCPTF